MAQYKYDRLSGQDNDFLLCEEPSLPMHVGGTQIFDAGPLLNEDGGIDFEAIKRLTESMLYQVPRYRQKLAWIPGRSHAVWVDDPQFNLHYHFRHASLPRPGTEEQLKLLTARIMEHPLDRSRPLWETWVIEGLDGGRFALINKIHHCIIDGASGVDLSQILLSTDPQTTIREAPRYIPRPIPSDTELKADELARQLMIPLRAAAGLVGFVRDTPDLPDEIIKRVSALGQLAGWKAIPASATPINRDVGPHRTIEWYSLPLSHLKAVRKAAECSINDIVLCTVTGAVGELMRRRQVRPEGLDFRVSSPVNTQLDRVSGAMGNHVSSWILRLPLEHRDPVAQLESIRKTTRELKRTGQASAVEMITAALDWLPIKLQSAATGTINMIVTNVPGPAFPLYLLGAKMLDIIPLPPLLENVGLVAGVLSYNGRVYWGFNADYDQLPDLDEFAEGIKTAFAALAEAYDVDLDSLPKPEALEVPESSPARRGWHHPVESSGLDTIDAADEFDEAPNDEESTDRSQAFEMTPKPLEEEAPIDIEH